MGGATDNGGGAGKGPSAGVLVVRYGIPAAFVLAGAICLFAAPSGTRVEAWALFTGAGLAVMLLNILYRMGVSGDIERDREESARAHFDRHGVWPGEDARERKRVWRVPEGIATPESEAAERVRLHREPEPHRPEGQPPRVRPRRRPG